MKSYNGVNKKTKTVIAGIIAAAFMVSPAVSFASEATGVDNGDKFVKNDFSIVTEDREETIEKVDETWNIVNMTDSPAISTREAGTTYKWEIESLKTHTIENIYRKKGQTLTVFCGLIKGDKYIVAGIIGPDNVAKVVKDSYAVSKEFEIQESGYYSVFARNINDNTINVNFAYYLN